MNLECFYSIRAGSNIAIFAEQVLLKNAKSFCNCEKRWIAVCKLTRKPFGITGLQEVELLLWLLDRITGVNQFKNVLADIRKKKKKNN